MEPIQKSQGSDFRVREAEPTDKDAEGIAESFKDAYHYYPFESYTDPQTVIQETIPSDDSRNLVVELKPGQTVKGETLESPRVVGTGSVKNAGSDKVKELGGAVIKTDFQGLDDTELYPTLLDARRDLAYEDGGEVVITKPVSTHAITQHEHNKRDFVVAGLSKNKYMEVFENEGRETVVPMVDSQSDFQNVSEALEPGEEPDVYLTESTDWLFDHVYNGLREKSGQQLKRNPRLGSGTEEVETAAEGYKLKEELIELDDPEKAGMAMYKLLPGGDMSLEEVNQVLGEKQEDEEYGWVGVTLDANHPYAWEVTENLSGEGFEPESFIPEKLRYNSEGPRDALTFQYSSSETGRIELINEAVEVARGMGLDPDTVSDTGRSHTQLAYL